MEWDGHAEVMRRGGQVFVTVCAMQSALLSSSAEGLASQGSIVCQILKLDVTGTGGNDTGMECLLEMRPIPHVWPPPGTASGACLLAGGIAAGSLQLGAAGTEVGCRMGGERGAGRRLAAVGVAVACMQSLGMQVSRCRSMDAPMEVPAAAEPIVSTGGPHPPALMPARFPHAEGGQEASVMGGAAEPLSTQHCRQGEWRRQQRAGRHMPCVSFRQHSRRQ